MCAVCGTRVPSTTPKEPNILLKLLLNLLLNYFNFNFPPRGNETSRERATLPEG